MSKPFKESQTRTRERILALSGKVESVKEITSLDDFWGFVFSAVEEKVAHMKKGTTNVR